MSVIVKTPPLNPGSLLGMLKVIVSPEQAVLIVSRKLPAPLSLVLVTTVGPQLTVIVAVAGEPKPAPPELVAPCT